MNGQLSVTWIARFFYRRGDLHPGVEARARPEEGIKTQRVVQRLRHAEDSRASAADDPAWRNGYRPEVPVSMDVFVAGQIFTISGRIDGAAIGSEDTLIEEYKTTRTPAREAHARHGPEHQAQLRLYAGLLAATDAPAARYRLRLTYVHPDHPLATRRNPSLDQQVDAQPAGTFDVEETLSASAARAFLADAVARVQAWFGLEIAHRQTRDGASDVLAFPYPGFRPHQRALALRCYRALEAREPLLLEAPTGTGKTAAILFPAVRALGRVVDGHVFNRIMFLTSRTTGSRAVLDALARINGARPWLRVVQLQARERLCELDGAPCEPRTCPRARGYFDRVRAAVREALDRVVVTADTLRDLASAHGVCPHELALDVAVWSDVIIGDYNYVFDPGVRLQRAAPDAETIVLVDEAHQLVSRVRDMLARQIDRDRVRAALREVPPEPFRRRIRGVAKQLDALAKSSSPGEQRIPPPAALMRALGRLAEEATESGLALEPWPETRELVFEALRWSVLEAEPDPRQCWRTIRSVTVANGLAVRLDYLDPGPEIRAMLEAAGTHVRYSGTVSPLGLYQRLHGFPNGPADRGGSLFHAEQLAVLHVPDVPTYLRARAGSLAQLVSLVAAVARIKLGRYLVAFPSFDYLDRFEAAVGVAHADLAVVAQTPRMTDAERTDFLDRLCAPLTDHSRLGLVVLGGIFGESVDFADAELSGVVCVGPGLAPPSLLAEDIARYWSAAGEDGRAIADLQPALVKTVQMAGRLLRGPESRGVLLLIDERFGDPAYRAFYPGYWQLERILAARVPARVMAFWQDKPMAGKLGGT